MLVLSRFEDQVIVIGEKGDVRIKVLRINGNMVKLGIEADKNIPVNREEVYLRLLAEQGLGENEFLI